MASALLVSTPGTAVIQRGNPGGDRGRPRSRLRAAPHDPRLPRLHVAAPDDRDAVVVRDFLRDATRVIEEFTDAPAGWRRRVHFGPLWSNDRLDEGVP